MDSNRKNYLVLYYDGNNKEFNYRSYQINIGVIKDLIGFDDVTYLISIDNNKDIHIMSYDNKFAYEETILLTEENTITISNYNYICSGKIDNLIKWDNISKSKRIFALFGDNNNNDNNNYLIYYNDTFIKFTSPITIPYLEKVNYGLKLGFVDIVNNQSTIYYLENTNQELISNDIIINVNSVVINSLFTDQTIQIKLDGQLVFDIYAYQGTEWKLLKSNNNEGNNDYEIVINEGNERVNIKLSAINEFTYCYDRINGVDYEYMNCIIKILEYDPVTNETLNIQRLLYHFIKQQSISQTQQNSFNYIYTYYFGYDKDNTIEYSTNPSTIINPYKLTNIINNLSPSESLNANNPVLFITVDNLTNNMYLISLLQNNQVNINFSDFNSQIIDSKLYNEIQHRRTINSGTNKYVFK